MKFWILISKNVTFSFWFDMILAYEIKILARNEGKWLNFEKSNKVSKQKDFRIADIEYLPRLSIFLNLSP